MPLRVGSEPGSYTPSEHASEQAVGAQSVDALLGFGPERPDGLPRLPTMLRRESQTCHVSPRFGIPVGILGLFSHT